MYYKVELPGIAKFIFLTSYSPAQTFSQDEAQYVWLEKELRAVSVGGAGGRFEPRAAQRKNGPFQQYHTLFPCQLPPYRPTVRRRPG